MFSVAVCDDEPVICSQFEKVIMNYKGLKIKTDVFFSGEKLYEALESGAYYDLIFLDIELGAVNGVDVGRMIRDRLDDEQVQIVYISALQEYAMELFSVRPMNFLVKPVKPEQIVQSIEKALKLKGAYDDFFEFSYEKQNYRIPFGHVEYFESRNRKIFIHAKNGIRQFYAKMDSIEKSCPENFTRIHQSYLINNMHVKSYRTDSIVMECGEELPISKRYKKKVSSMLLNNGGVLI